MHRAVSRLSRRVGLPPSPAPLPRSFKTSATYLNSDSGDSNGSSSSAKAPPRFGRRFAPRNGANKSGLSAAEQAMRDSLVASTPPPPNPEPQPAPKVEAEAKTQSNSESRAESKSAPLDSLMQSLKTPSVPKEADAPEKVSSRWGRSSRQASRSSGLSAAEQAMRDSMMARSHSTPPRTPSSQQEQSKLSDRIPGTPARSPSSTYEHRKRDREMRRNGRHPPSAAEKDPRYKPDWECPSCKNLVFAKRRFCPFCDTPQPRQHRPKREFSEDSQPRPQRNNYASNGDRSVASVTAGKFDELSRSFLDQADESPETSEPAETSAIGIQENEANQDQEKIEKAQADASWKKNQWSWDMTALDQLEIDDAEEPSAIQKKTKRKNGKKGRGGEDNDGDGEDRPRREDKKRSKQKQKKEAELAPSPLYLPEFISVSNLADVIGVRPGQFIERMEDMGFEDVEYNHVLDAETAGLVAAEFNYEAIFDTGEEDMRAAAVPEDTSHLPSRPPVVTIMGHVDHGKTTILDWLRKSSIAATEHGGITQHIGAFSVAMPSGKTITFLDTPGHSAFLEMRRRGADVTDIVVLVVAADDSVKPQTIEAIKHATQANVPIIVAISKVDKEGSNPERVKADLAGNGVHVEDFGGDVQAIAVSGKTGTGMIELEEAIGALSEMLDHRADTAGKAEGWVLEASTKAYGRVASALVRRGTLRPGDVIVAGTTWARVRTLRNEAGISVNEATPGMPIEIDGWREQPAAGTEILQADSEQRAKEVVNYRLERSETQKMGEDMAALNEARKAASEKRRLENAGSEDAAKDVEQQTGPKAVNFIIKADVDGSAEAVMNSMAAIGNNEVYANILRSSVGPVTEFDIEHAATAGGKVISFNMAIDPNIGRLAEQEGVAIMDHNIIYKLIDDIKEDLSSHLPPTVTHRVTGEAEVQQLFDITIKGREKMSIAGCRVRNGIIHRSRKARVMRGDKTVYDGTIISLKNVKKDVTEMRKDTECGISFEEWSDFAVGDQVQCYEEIHEKRYL